MGAFKSFLQNTGHVLYQHKDDILFFGGMAVSTVGTIVACKKSMDYKDILIDDSKEQKEKVVSAVKHYAIPGILLVGGDALMTVSHQDQKSKIAKLGIDIVAITSLFMNYRQNVANKWGSDEENYIYQDTMQYRNDPIGNAPEVQNQLKAGLFEVLYDESAYTYLSGLGQNRNTILKELDTANYILNNGVYSVVLLKDVIRDLGIPFENSDVFFILDKYPNAGWIQNVKDVSIDFGLNDGTPAHNEFLRGTENCTYLNFNCVPDVFADMRKDMVATPDLPDDTM